MNRKAWTEVAGAAVLALSELLLAGQCREMRNTLERLAHGHSGSPGFGQSSLRASAEDGDTVHLGVGTTVEEAEKRLILKTLESTNNNKTRAAEILGISLKTLHNKLKEYGAATADAALVREE